MKNAGEKIEIEPKGSVEFMADLMGNSRRVARGFHQEPLCYQSCIVA